MNLAFRERKCLYVTIQCFDLTILELIWCALKQKLHNEWLM
jgi:hypothetical protein